jgi:23S rRNA pseudouridine1911/1915/1917 synthase
VAENEQILVPPGVSERLDRFLAGRIDLSRSAIQRGIREGWITLNDAPTRANHVVRPGETITCRRPAPRTPSLAPEPIPLEVAYEDEHLLVIDKPAGMVVHPAPGAPDGTLVNALLHRCPDLDFRPGDTRPGIVHRLDRGTSGLLLVARTEAIREKLSRALRERRIRRTYVALSFGHLKTRQGTIDTPIGRHPLDRRRMATFGPNLRPALTRYRVLESYSVCELLEIDLETGRTHQIRVHFSSIGHPLVGDTLYHGGPGRERGFGGPRQRERAREILSWIDRQALHARRLAFPHPVTGREIVVESEPPRDFSRVLELLRRAEGGGDAAGPDNPDAPSDPA